MTEEAERINAKILALEDEMEPFEAEIKAYWEAELNKPQRPVYYLPSAQMAPESLCQPLSIY